MTVSDHQMTEAWKQVLSLSRLKPGQVVTLLTGSNSNPQSVRTATAAVVAAGGILNKLDLPPINGDKAVGSDPLAYLGTTPLSGNPAAIAALKASDIVLDMMFLLFSPEQQEILETGTKILMAVEPPEILCRMVPTAADRERVLKNVERFKAASTMRVVSDAGTDFSCSLGEFPTLGEYGFVDAPGRWDHWPSGFVLTWPNEKTTSGRIVIDRGDILLPMKSYVRDPIELKFENGFVTSIKGGVDADMLSDFMESFKDPEAYAMAHIGWGLQRRARWFQLGLYDKNDHIGMDARAFEGNFMFSLGPNNEVGGTRATACHLDIPLRNCSVLLDGLTVVEKGKVLDKVIEGAC